MGGNSRVQQDSSSENSGGLYSSNSSDDENIDSQKQGERDTALITSEQAQKNEVANRKIPQNKLEEEKRLSVHLEAEPDLKLNNHNSGNENEEPKLTEVIDSQPLEDEYDQSLLPDYEQSYVEEVEDITKGNYGNKEEETGGDYDYKIADSEDSDYREEYEDGLDVFNDEVVETYHEQGKETVANSESNPSENEPTIEKDQKETMGSSIVRESEDDASFSDGEELLEFADDVYYVENENDYREQTTKYSDKKRDRLNGRTSNDLVLASKRKKIERGENRENSKKNNRERVKTFTLKPHLAPTKRKVRSKNKKNVKLESNLREHSAPINNQSQPIDSCKIQNSSKDVEKNSTLLTNSVNQSNLHTSPHSSLNTTQPDSVSSKAPVTNLHESKNRGAETSRHQPASSEEEDSPNEPTVMTSILSGAYMKCPMCRRPDQRGHCRPVLWCGILPLLQQDT